MIVASTLYGVSADRRSEQPSFADDQPIEYTEVLPPEREDEPAPRPKGERAVSWPGRGEATVPAHTRGKVGDLPVTFASTGTNVASFRVHVADQEQSARAGLTGVIVSVTPSTPTGGEATVGVDYTAFRDAVGAEFGSRLRLVTLPSCALTTPDVPECRVHTPVRSTNDAGARVVTATVPLAGAHHEVPQSGKPTAAMTVLAAVGESEGPSGSFEASSLKPSGSWSVTGATGAFTWSYPLQPPPSASGAVAPKITLAYNSSSVDGLTASTNNQSSWVGGGWNYSSGSIERTYRACGEDKTLPAAQQTGDYCWGPPIVSLSLGDQSAELIRDDATGTWHPANDNGSRVELLKGAPNGAHDGEHWKVTTTAGVSYYFGLSKPPGNTTQEQTQSAWTVPVYSPRSDGPCYRSTGFSDSKCDMAWRWNLDYVEDAHGNATAYYYAPEYNHYGANATTTAVRYTRGGTLKRIDYGLRKVNSSVYGQAVPDQIVFDVTERCVPSGTVTCAPEQRTAQTAANWPDVPTDQECKAGAVCNTHAPTFWSTKKLSTITTQYNAGAGPVKVDRYQLAHEYPETGDRSLQLSSITHTAFGTDGSQITAPPMTFRGQLFDNRVRGHGGLPAMAHWRLTNIATDSGTALRVTYSTPDCASGNVPTDLANNTRLCYPVYWTQPFRTEPTLDFFHKYVTTEVAVEERNALSPTQITGYTYLGSPAWHHDDNELVKPEHRTYGQFRGYQRVEVRSGNPEHTLGGVPDRKTLVRTTYFRGMDGDPLPGGARRSATVTNSLGETVPDVEQFADSEREVQTFDGESGSWVTSTVTDHVVVATTATRARTGLSPRTATVVNVGKSREIVRLAGGGTRTTTTSKRYDGTGRLVATTESGDGVPDLCTTTRYADNTTSWIRDRVKETITSQQACPADGVEPTPVIKAVKHFYDGSATLGSVPGAGDLTRTDTATQNTGGALTYATTAQAVFDAAGRPTSTTDAVNRITKIEYTPADGGVLSKTVTTNAKGHKKTQETEPGRGKVVAAVDEGGRRTDAVYDAAGRLTAVWKPGQVKGTTQASATYEYLLRTNGPLAVTTRTLVDTGTSTDYVAQVSLFDGFGQLRQSQMETRDGKRVVTDVFYDSHGWKRLANNRYLITGAPGSTMVEPVADSAVNDRTRYDYDGSGRTVKETALKGVNETWNTTTVYGGDRTTVFPPRGGVTKTTITDARKRDVELRQYTTPPTVTGNVVSGGEFQATKYMYTATGLESGITDAAGTTWAFEYDFLGRRVRQLDPDSGVTNSAYDLAGQLTSTTDARGNVVSFEYDSIGRKTAEYAGTGTAKTTQATWIYDGATNGVGKPYVATRNTPTGAFQTATAVYDAMGSPTKVLTKVPTGETGLGGTYTTQYTYSSTGQVTSITPHAAGGLPGEAIAISYDRFGRAVTMQGYNTYVAAAAYTPFGEARQYTMGPSNNKAWLTYEYDEQTRKLTGVNLAAQQATAQVDDVRYTYDPFGNRVRAVNTQGQAGTAPVRTECYRYDPLNRLTDAWTAADDCAGAPSTTALGSVSPYWTSWSFDVGGRRATETKHAAAGDTTTRYEYGSQPHAVTETTTGTVSKAYTYDDSGNTRTRPGPGGQETLEWDGQNRLTSVASPAGPTSFVYDADGEQVLRRDPGSTTLYLPNQELTRNASTGAVTGTRYYTFNGVTVAMRVGGVDPRYVVSDPHNTATVTVGANGVSVTRRTLDPYGNVVGAAQGVWPDSHGFLGKSMSTDTGLTDVGARKYDPVLGRFLSVDPLMDPKNPQQLTAYTYGNDNPVTYSDPTGEFFGMFLLPYLIQRVRSIFKLVARVKKHWKVPDNAEYRDAGEKGVGKMFDEWLNSDHRKDRPVVYMADENDAMARNWKGTSQAETVRYMIQDQMKKGIYGPDSPGYDTYLYKAGGAGWLFDSIEGAWDAWTIFGARAGNESPSDVSNFLGSFSADYEVVDVRNDIATVQVVVGNAATQGSASRSPVNGQAGGSKGFVNVLLEVGRILGGNSELSPPPIENQQDQYHIIEVTMTIPCKQKAFRRINGTGPFEQIDVRYC